MAWNFFAGRMGVPDAWLFVFRAVGMPFSVFRTVKFVTISLMLLT